MFKKKRNNKGFTLVELLVVIAIIGILAVVAVPSLFKNMNRAKASDAIAYMSAARTAAVAEYASTQSTVSISKGDADDNKNIDKLVSDAPTEVTALTVGVNGSNGAVTITATVDDAIKDEVEKQAASSFTGTTVEINKK